MIGNNHNPTQLAFLSGSFHNFLEYPIGNFLRGELSRYRASLLAEALTRAKSKQGDGYSTTDAKIDFVNNIQCEDRNFLGETIYLPLTRLSEGAVVGYIDYALGALKKFGGKWVDIATTQKFDKLSEVREWLLNKGIVFCDVITNKQLQKYEKKKEVKVNGQVVATKVDGEWRSIETFRPIKGKVPDLLYKLGIPYISTAHSHSEPLVRSHPKSSQIGMIHGYPIFNKSGKPHSKSNILSPDNACSFIATWKDRKSFKCILNTPSPFIISAITNDYGQGLEVQIIRNKAISKLHSTKSNYETLCALLEWSKELDKIETKKHTALETSLRSMGYDSIQITSPKHEDIFELVSSEIEVTDFDSEILSDLCKYNIAKNHIDTVTENYIEAITPEEITTVGHDTIYVYFNSKKHPETTKSHTHSESDKLVKKKEPVPDSSYRPSRRDLSSLAPWATKTLNRMQQENKK